MVRLKNKGIVLNDGEFELLLVSYPKSIFSFFLTACNLLLGRYKSNGLFFTRTTYMNFDSEEEIPWTIDGEPVVSAPKNIIIKTQKNAFQLYISNHLFDSDLYK